MVLEYKIIILGLDALLDREVMTPALPDFHLVDSSVRISLGDLQIESEAMSKVRQLSLTL